MVKGVMVIAVDRTGRESGSRHILLLEYTFPSDLRTLSRTPIPYYLTMSATRRPQTIEAASLDRLRLTIQRLVDADLVLEEDASEMLERLDAERLSPASADWRAIQQLAADLAALIAQIGGTYPPVDCAIVNSLKPSLASK
jgi:hypothetical protein